MSDPQYPGPASALADRIAGISVAMLTTVGEDLRLHSRPMMTQDVPTNDGLWFFTGARTVVAQNIQHRPTVNISYVDLARQRYVSVAGTARLVHDTERMRTMWRPALANWIPKGIHDPDLIMIQVDVDEADYWDDSSSTFVRIAGVIRDLLGDRKQPHLVDRGHLEMHTPPVSSQAAG